MHNIRTVSTFQCDLNFWPKFHTFNGATQIKETCSARRTDAIYDSSIRRRLNGFSHDYLCNHQIHTFNFRFSLFRFVVRRSFVFLFCFFFLSSSCPFVWLFQMNALHKIKLNELSLWLHNVYAVFNDSQTTSRICVVRVVINSTAKCETIERSYFMAQWVSVFFDFQVSSLHSQTAKKKKCGRN